MKCPSCNLQIARKNFNRHKTNKHPEDELTERFVCRICKKSYQNEANYISHFKCKHSEALKMRPAGARMRPAKPTKMKNPHFRAAKSSKNRNQRPAIILPKIKRAQTAMHQATLPIEEVLLAEEPENELIYEN